MALYQIPHYDRGALYSQAATVAVGLAVLQWWPWVPTLAIGFLGVVAAIMAVRAESFTTPEKVVWIIIAFSLFAVEMRSVLKDRDEFAARQYELRIRADEVRSEEEKAFTKLLAQEKRTFEADAKQRKKEGAHFSSLLGSQKTLFDRQNEMIESANGHLIPGVSPTPTMKSLGCDHWSDVKPDDYFIILGEYTQVVRKFPWGIGLNIFPKNGAYGTYSKPIQFTQTDDGFLKLLVEVRDKNGEIAVKFDDDGFVVNPLFIKGHPNKSTLVVESRNGDTALRVTYSNKHVFSLQGQLAVDGETVLDTRKFPHVCLPAGMELEVATPPPPRR